MHASEPVRVSEDERELVSASERELASMLDRLDAAFDEARRDPRRTVPCRRGCSSCCAAVFDIDEADAERLGRWLEGAGAETRREVFAGAQRVVEHVAAAAKDLAAAGEREFEEWEPSHGFRALHARAITRLATETGGAACPLLDESGACRAREHRPVICRLQGLPWRDAASGDVLEDACRLEPDMARNEPADFDLAALHAARAEARLAIRAAASKTGGTPPGRTFIAAALLGQVRRLTED